MSASIPRAVIVGAGPVGCLVAIELRKRGFAVDVYERGVDIRTSPPARGHSFNLTLTRRGLNSLSGRLVDLLYAGGVPLPQRIVHRADGTISYQPYGPSAEHHLLSIPRLALHHLLLEEAERAGARLLFGHECVGADPVRASAAFLADGTRVHQARGNLLVGCDGANSFVRHAMARHGSRISQERVTEGFVEVTMPAGENGLPVLLERLRDPCVPRSGQDGLHSWPRGNLMLIAQPNVDNTYTTSLWLPFFGDAPSRPSWATIRTPEDVRWLFAEYFPDTREFLPSFDEDVLSAPPGALKTVRCSPYHHGRTVLLGDAAHTLVPFFGQGINCSFEDVRCFMEILDRNLVELDVDDALAGALPEFTLLRKPAGDAITDLSLAMGAQLKRHSATPAFQARAVLERRLHEKYPDLYIPLYHAVAFTSTPYHEVVDNDERQRAVLDDLCQRFDVVSDADRIIDSYAAVIRGVPHPHLLDVPATSGLDLAPAQCKDLLDEVSARLLNYQDDLAKMRYPASFPADAPVAAPEPEAPRTGTRLPALLDTVFDRALPSGMMHAHPGFMAHVPSGGLFQAAVGEFLARSLNRFAGAWAAAPGFAQIELDVIRWFCNAMGYGENAFGYLTTGGSIATFMAIRCALEEVTEPARHRGAVYVSEQGHFSVQKSAKLAGIAGGRVRVISTGADLRMDLSALRAAVERDLRAGITPVCVVATAGTTNTGAVDDLRAIAELCREYGVWLHADACFGGFFRLTERGRVLLGGIEEADSIAVDAHKSLFLPHGNSALLVKEKRTLKAAFQIPGAAYIPELSQDDEHVDMMNYGPELTREIRGLTAWLPIKMHGLAAFERSLDHKLDLATELATRLALLDGIAVVPRGEPHLPTVAFRVTGEDSAARTERLSEVICGRGNVYVATSALPEQGTVIRVCIMHHQTNEMIVEQLLEDVRWGLRSIDRKGAPC